MSKQYAMFPIKHRDIFDMYQKQIEDFWTATEINLDKDEYDFKYKLTEDERFFVKNILAFFAGSDEIVNLNLSENLIPKIGVKEAVHFYRMQMAMEDIHSHSYALQLDTFIKDEEEKQITKILPRKNELKRPVIANVDRALIITSAKSPDLSLLLLDKMLSLVIHNSIKPLICITKS